ncbi:LysR family transcriptional regulator [Elongatibacter sediminis]|uniref:LysR family transcriptional regulator n=1 Tax=Elongatibacter sediminis TaxID=3119006 RepID=A0AAW9RBL7_9GAMM
MQGINWQDLRCFLEVGHAGTLTGAARRLGVNQTTVSRRITALEKALNAPLFDRSANGWFITPVGEAVLRSAEAIEDEVLTISRLVQIDRQELSGKLRVTAPDVCIQGLLMPGLNRFSERYPDIDIELIATEETLDLSVHDADIAFRATDKPPPNVVGTHIADFAYAVYATPEILQQHREKPDSVGAIAWVGDRLLQPDWVRTAFPEMGVRYRANSLNVAFTMARQGLGFALLPCGLGDPSSRLRRVPTDYRPPSKGFWLLSHIDLRTTARIRIFRDFMLDSIKPYIPLIEGRQPRAFSAEDFAAIAAGRHTA